jgi:hypothetical protein
MTDAIKLDPEDIDELVSISRATGVPMIDLKALAEKGAYFTLNHETKGWMIIPAEHVDEDLNLILEDDEDGSEVL